MQVSKKITAALTALEKELAPHAIVLELNNNILLVSGNNKCLSFFLADENADFATIGAVPFIPADYLVSAPEKIAGMLLSKLGLNKKVYARLCVVKKIERSAAETFLQANHLMGATQSAYNWGLFYTNELVAVASFSKGRKMNRLDADQRSFELIRFCTKMGITVTGGLTRLLKTFYTEKNAGDIMSYVDKQLSDGSSFLRAGFKHYGETAPNYFLINKVTYERLPLKDKSQVFDETKFYITQNSGNIKLVYTPGEKL